MRLKTARSWLRGGILGVALLTGIALAGAAHDAGAANTSVSMTDFQFGPAAVTVSVGDTVTWVNNSATPHTTTSSSGAWDSGIMNGGQSFSFTFRSAGTFAYSCTSHPQMTGSITVQAAAAAPAATTSPGQGGSTPATPAAGGSGSTATAPRAGTGLAADSTGAVTTIELLGLLLAATGGVGIAGLALASRRRR
jgi:plastocyanin